MKRKIKRRTSKIKVHKPVTPEEAYAISRQLLGLPEKPSRKLKRRTKDD